FRQVVRDDARVARPVVHRLVAVERYELTTDAPDVEHQHRHLAHPAVHAGGEPRGPAADDHDFVQPSSVWRSACPAPRRALAGLARPLRRPRCRKRRRTRPAGRSWAIRPSPRRRYGGRSGRPTTGGRSRSRPGPAVPRTDWYLHPHYFRTAWDFMRFGFTTHCGASPALR